jgi:hypothetical protein
MMDDTVVTAATADDRADPESDSMASPMPASTALVVYGTVDVIMGALVCPAEAYELTGGNTATAVVVLYYG